MLTFLWDRLDNSFTYGSPATAPEKVLDGLLDHQLLFTLKQTKLNKNNKLGLGWDSKSRVYSKGLLPHKGDSRVYIELSGNQYFRSYLPYYLYTPTITLVYFVSSTSLDSCQLSSVVNYTK